MGAGFTVRTEHFEGPLDLLLALIEKRKLFVNDISLVQVTDDYISHVRDFEEFPIGEVADFVLVASTLVLIKSKSLLPTLTLSEDESVDIEDLKGRLRLYKKVKELSKHVQERFGKHIIFERNQSKQLNVVFSPDESITTENLHTAFQNVLNNLPKKEKLPEATVKKVISIDEMIDRLTDRIQSSLQMSFSEFSSYRRGAPISKEVKVNVIIGFLAMLELVKQGIVRVEQEEHFGEIGMETQDFSVPNYQ